MAHVQYEDHLHDHDRWLALPGYPLEPDFPEEEYRLRIDRARQLMSETGLEALVITSGAVGQWFTSAAEPHDGRMTYRTTNSEATSRLCGRGL